ncbi:single-stranded-DNA-specific exonuclease RecJ [Desulfospira joergensenii]|uniref:single-stranded-DNA-specific exonuclease RecJ n=1 Tax=Desulfospira joergensenii TaxID=53329 RepID=UPI0003FB8A5D|nr:single-stranded-DNA-specific exonuclease RecJ [Desulfospira joergensenii]
MESLFTYLTPDPEKAKSLSRELDCLPVIAGLLLERGITTAKEARSFLSPGFSELGDPFALKDMDKAVERIYAGILNQEKIMIFGDFDADGVTATALLVEFLTLLKADLTWYIPHRIQEGYGLQPDHVARAAEMDVDLIITVDCGISSIDAVEAAAAEDIDVIVTDHHEPGESLPLALALIDPKQEDCPSGLDYLAGVGVAFFLVMALRKFFRDKGVWKEINEPSLLPFLDLFAIGTIGDMVPLIKDNRILCVAGIKEMQKNQRPGLAALFRASRLDPGRLDSDDVSFKIVPRINAAGRISHARICVSLLICPSHSEADRTAQILDELNRKRQMIEKEIVADIENRISRDAGLLDHRLLMIWDSDWNPSVLGIAASKLSKKYVRPVVLMSSVNGNIVGSCRSINQINIHQALAENAHLLVKFGGHSMAAGLTLTEKSLKDLNKGLLAHLDTCYSDPDFIKTLTIDAELDFKEINFSLARELSCLRPFGTANPEPVFLLRNARVISSHILGGLHRKMMLQDDRSGSGDPIEAFHFNVRDMDNLPSFFSHLAFRLKINKFRPGTVQIIIEDL